MSRYDDPAGVISWIEEKAAQLTGLPVSHGEVGSPGLSICSSPVSASIPPQYPCTKRHCEHYKTVGRSLPAPQTLGEGSQLSCMREGLHYV